MTKNCLQSEKTRILMMLLFERNHSRWLVNVRGSLHLREWSRARESRDVQKKGLSLLFSSIPRPHSIHSYCHSCSCFGSSLTHLHCSNLCSLLLLRFNWEIWALSLLCSTSNLWIICHNEVASARKWKTDNTSKVPFHLLSFRWKAFSDF